MNTPTTVFNPYTSCTPTYNSNGQINCPSSSGCQSGSVQYTLCPYNPYLSDGKKCVSTTCETSCCPEGYSCNSHNVNCVDGCYTTNVKVNWIAPLVFFSNLTDSIQPNDFDMVITFHTENTDPCVVEDTCPTSCCGSLTDDVSRQCCATKPCGCCCYPSPNTSSDLDKIVFTDTMGGSNGSLTPIEHLPISKSIITPLNACCPNPCSEFISVKIIVQLNNALVGTGASTFTTKLTTTSGKVDIPIKVGSALVKNQTGNLILNYTYTCVCNEPTWTIYAGQLNFDSVT